MVPQAGAVTPVGQVTLHVTAVSVVPVTNGVNVWVVLVITLAVVGEIVKEIVDVAPPPQPSTPTPSARANIEQNFHRLMPVLPRTPNIRSIIGPRFVSASKIVAIHRGCAFALRMSCSP
jgi:hypothetical protein